MNPIEHIRQFLPRRNQDNSDFLDSNTESACFASSCMLESPSIRASYSRCTHFPHASSRRTLLTRDACYFQGLSSRRRSRTHSAKSMDVLHLLHAQSQLAGSSGDQLNQQVLPCLIVTRFPIGLFSAGATELLQRLTREADEVNVAYTSCRPDSLNLREVLK